MKVLDAELDKKPTASAVCRMAEARIRNLQCFSELESFNDTGKWKNEHPLLVNFSERFKLEQLKKNNPEEFLRQHAACLQNIRRYRSFLANDARKDKHDADRRNLKKHENRKLIFETLLNNE